MNPAFDGAAWRKSRRSQQTTDQCVEVAAVHGYMGVRDSKDPDGPQLILAADDWRTFVARHQASPGR
ncbi:DUF397 domain-containing protein [Actinomadura algeriensis]|uniref:DUF397 domain-containing protein n=1 Tax=Actinomadura algeriensis TaxID=1679523 RepID=A0ABR9JPJ9_9ACTN|nr:DUF397 domain-containing protein [Actinomadura algeriensis]MBE1532496.1 hypothetical protein [Actinomadura algeriensis]